MSSQSTFSQDDLKAKAGGKSGAPSTEMEHIIAGIWQQVLQLRNLSADDNFFDLGGHSLALVSVYEQLRQRVPGEFTLMEMFEHPSVRRLARHLSGMQGEEESAGKAVQQRMRKQKEARRQQKRFVRERENTNE